MFKRFFLYFRENFSIKPFPGKREKAFLNYYFKNTIIQTRFIIILGTIEYALIGVLDLWIIPSIHLLAWQMRYLFVCPLMALALYLTYQTKKEYQIQIISLTGSFLIGIPIIIMIACANEVHSHIYYVGLILLLVNVYTLLRMRFVYASVFGFLFTLMYIVSMRFMDFSFPIVINNVFFFCMFNVVGMVACYMLESYIRKEYESVVSFKKANRKFYKASIIDGLTGVANRRFLNDKLYEEWNRLCRNKKPLSLILLDIDFFKQYNDCFGHHAGDECLVQIAWTIKKVVKRAGELVARYGGEEFAVVLPNTNIEKAKYLAEQIREKVLSLKLQHLKSSVNEFVTVSLGVAMLVPSQDRTYEQLLKDADKALYQAKENGRNRVEVV